MANAKLLQMLMQKIVGKFPEEAGPPISGMEAELAKRIKARPPRPPSTISEGGEAIPQHQQGPGPDINFDGETPESIYLSDIDPMTALQNKLEAQTVTPKGLSGKRRELLESEMLEFDPKPMRKQTRPQPKDAEDKRHSKEIYDRETVNEQFDATDGPETRLAADINVLPEEALPSKPTRRTTIDELRAKDKQEAHKDSLRPEEKATDAERGPDSGGGPADQTNRHVTSEEMGFTDANEQGLLVNLDQQQINEQKIIDEVQRRLDETFSGDVRKAEQRKSFAKQGVKKLGMAQDIDAEINKGFKALEDLDRGLKMPGPARKFTNEEKAFGAVPDPKQLQLMESQRQFRDLHKMMSQAAAYARKTNQITKGRPRGQSGTFAPSLKEVMEMIQGPPKNRPQNVAGQETPSFAGTATRPNTPPRGMQELSKARINQAQQGPIKEGKTISTLNRPPELNANRLDLPSENSTEEILMDILEGTLPQRSDESTLLRILQELQQGQ